MHPTKASENIFIKYILGSNRQKNFTHTVYFVETKFNVVSNVLVNSFSLVKKNRKICR